MRVLLRKITERFLLTIARSVQSHSGVSVTGAADVPVPVDDLRARFKTFRITLNAIKAGAVVPVDDLRARFKTVRITRNAMKSDAVVPVDNLRPRFKVVQITLDAIEDIRFCEKLFDKWTAELDKCVAIRISRHSVPSNGNNGFTESRAIPMTQTIGSTS